MMRGGSGLAGRVTEPEPQITTVLVLSVFDCMYDC